MISHPLDPPCNESSPTPLSLFVHEQFANSSIFSFGEETEYTRFCLQPISRLQCRMIAGRAGMRRKVKSEMEGGLVVDVVCYTVRTTSCLACWLMSDLFYRFFFVFVFVFSLTSRKASIDMHKVSCSRIHFRCPH